MSDLTERTKMTIKADIERVREWVGGDHGIGQYHEAIDAFERIVALIPANLKTPGNDQKIFTPRNAPRGLSDEC